MMTDVTVRIPVQFESTAEAAGFINGAVEIAMEKKGWVGGVAVIWRDEKGDMQMFHNGLVDGGYKGVFPHGEPELADGAKK